MNNDNQNPGQNPPGSNNPVTPPSPAPQWPTWPQPEQNNTTPQAPVENQTPYTPPTVMPSFTPPTPTPPQNDLSTNPFLTAPPNQAPSPVPSFEAPPIPAPDWPQPTSHPTAQPITQPTAPINYNPPTLPYDPASTTSYAPANPQSPSPMDFVSQPVPAPLQPQNPAPLQPLPDQNWANQALNAPPTDLSNLQTQPQTPPIQDQSYSMQQTQPSTNFTTSSNTQFSNTAPPPVEMPEPAPTDLSQLTTTITDQTPRTDIYNPVVSSPENLTTSASSPNNNPALHETKPESKIPKIAIIIAGIVLLLLVTGASAYFILGIGQTQSTVPATQNTNQPPLTNPPSTLPKRTVATPVPGATTGETDNTDFGALGGSKPQSTSSAKPQSAAEILRQQTQK